MQSKKSISIDNGSYGEQLKQEKTYLDRTIQVLDKELKNIKDSLNDRKSELIATRRDMWENSVHFSSDFMRLTEMNQHLSEVNSQTASYMNTSKRVARYNRMKDNPYFGRFDFKESGYDDIEKIYIGLSNLMDSKTHDIYVYDWRAAISSLFYQYELGNAAYSAPSGEVEGEILLKRQYKIKDSELKYFFDCSIRIDDEMLQEVLGNNSSARMKNIVETIQKEQDKIIRDIESELLIVQGAAGSGKTSVALHRIAFLIYQGLSSKMSSSDFIILSPNMMFSQYISEVLPELGEDDVLQITFEEIAEKLFANKLKFQGRSQQLESVIASQNNKAGKLRKQSIDFKGSRQFKELIDRFLRYYKHNMIDFKDIYYAGRIIEKKEVLKAFLLNNKLNTPMTKRLKRLEMMMFERIRPLQKERLPKLEKFVLKIGNHELEIKSYARLLSLWEFKRFAKQVRSFTEIDYMSLYSLLLRDKELLKKLSYGLNLPDNIDEIIELAGDNISEGKIAYEDIAPLLYIKLKTEGNEEFSSIKHLVIDEAQDYYPMHYEVIKLLFADARYTVLGDINQEIDKDTGMSIYDSISDILKKEKSIRLTMNKSYRSSFEINAFNSRMLSPGQKVVAFERHEAEPNIVRAERGDILEEALINDINNCLSQGFESIAIITKTKSQGTELYNRLKALMKLELIDEDTYEVKKGVLIIPSYMAKGLEFDVVLVYDISEANYNSQIDKRLLYIACTRALHRLSLYYCGEKSRFI